MRIEAKHLTIDGVPKTKRELLEALGRGERSFDLSGVERIDSAGLSLVLALVREAKRRAVRISFEGVPEQLLELSRLYGMDELTLFETQTAQSETI